MQNFYKLEGRNVILCDNVTEWVQWFENTKEDRVIAYTEIESGIEVATVFLGVNHRFLPDNGRPVLFETIVVGGDLNEEIDRYCTYDEAETGHKAMVERVKSQIS